MQKIKSLSLQTKITGVYIVASIIMLIVSALLIIGINAMSVELDMVYQENRHLNELATCLDSVQSSMKDYLTYKSSDALENYYICDQKYNNMINELSESVTDSSFDRMERNIKNMSIDYLRKVSSTIEAKRGRNVEKYRNNYEEATKLYGYISDYIDSLNGAKFDENSVNYTVVAKAFKRFETLGLGMIALVMAVNLVLIVSLIRKLIAPITKLAGTANEVAEGNLDVELQEPISSDETGILINAFNKMVVSIREYIERLKDSMEKERSMQEKELMMETHLKDAQLKYLQAQINPHFLFNTLNAGAQLAMMEGADRTYEYVQTVADFFRYNVKKENELVNIGEEVDLIDNYIEILNVRFSGDIHYSKQIDGRLLKTPMPSMILQPIVENAVNHGIREMGADGEIFLRVYRENDIVRVSVRDNGKGMTAEDIDRVINGTWKYEEHKADNNGIGMDNIIARLKLYAGNDDVIRIYSEGENKGTEVVVCLPYENTEN